MRKKWSWAVISCLLVNSVTCQEVFNTTPPLPRGNFTCSDKATGFYADLETNCRLYHRCDDHGNRFTYNCPEETAFRQDASICDHAHLVDCEGGAAQFHSDRLKVKTEENLHRSFHITQKPADSKSDNNKNPSFAYSSNIFLRNRVTNDKFQRLKQDVDRTDTFAGKVQRPSIFLEAPRFSEGRLNNAINSLPAKFRETESRVENVVTLLPSRSLRVPLISPPIREHEEFDPFYPKATGTTEAHYTPSKNNHRVTSTSTTRRPWLNDFVIPDKLPDLNNLEDLVDRRKYFFIPKVNSI